MLSLKVKLRNRNWIKTNAFNAFKKLPLSQLNAESV